MTFLEQLQSHKGSLLHLKTQLYWYYRGSCDENPGQICLLLDAAADPGATAPRKFATTASGADSSPAAVAALLLLGGSPRWFWIFEQDVELLSEKL